MTARDRVRGQSRTDLLHRSPAELHSLREELRTERDQAYATCQRIAAAANDRPLTRAQDVDHRAAADACREAGELIAVVEDAIATHDVDRSQHVAIGRTHGARDRYAEGAPLTREQTMAGFARSQGQVREGDDDLSLRRFLRGAVTGDWTDASDERRAMGEGALATGGVMVPTVLAAEVIDLARNRTRVLEAGARLVPMASKTVDMARWEGDPSAAWHTEHAVIAPSDATLGKVTLTAKALASIVVLSRELLEDADGIESELREALAAQFALTIDRAALYGSGVDPEPRGLANTTGVTTLSMGTNGAAPASYDFLVDAVGELADRNEVATATIMSPRTARTLGKLKDTTGQPLTVPGYVAGVPRLDTAQVPNDLTHGTAEAASEAFTGDWSRLLVGVRTGLSVEVLRERYVDRGEIGLACWWRGDVAVARPSAFVRTTGVLA